MINQENIENALEFIRTNAQNLAQAKADRVYLEQFRKSKKALLFADAPATVGDKHATIADRENYAYSHPEYLALLDGLKAAIEREEKIKWMMTAAELKVDVWRTQQANARTVDASHL